MTMPAAQYLTLEEFLSPPSPLPTILLPRSHAWRLVQLCELAEMTPPSNFLNFLFQNENDAAAANSCNDNDVAASVAGGKLPSSSSALTSNGGYNNVNRNPHILVTQMALLLYLGEYTHAQHLWTRSQAASPLSSSDNAASNNNDSVQLEQLWNAAKYMHLWNIGGTHNNDSVASSSFRPSNAATDASEDAGMASSMQIEIKDEEDELVSLEERVKSSSALPLSTLALRALHSCHASKMEPLSTYAAELKGAFRSRINQRLHKYVTKLDTAEFRLRMNFSDCRTGSGGEADEQEETEGDWIAYGWKKEKGGYLVSDDVHSGAELGGYDDDVYECGMSTNGIDGIEKLTNIVMFLEEKLNA